MGLSSKQVSGGGLDWGQTLLQSGTLELPRPPPVRRQQQQLQQQSEPLKCPRCDSTNTKFCYYNNYNKSQPRHFCKSCKRHWTKGGTLRNVPVGGGRKNKRLKSSKATSAATDTAITTTNIDHRNNTHMGIQRLQQQRQSLPLAHGDDQKMNMSEILYQAMIRPPSSLQPNSININNFDSKNFSSNNGIYLGSTQNRNLHFPFSSLSSFDGNPSSISTILQSPNVYNYVCESETVDDPTITSTMPMPTTSTTITQPWQVVPPTSSVMDMTSNWSWDDMDMIASTDLNLPWDDSNIKPF